LRAISRRRSPPCEGADGSATLIVTASCIGERLSSRAPAAWLLSGLLTKDTALNEYHKHRASLRESTTGAIAADRLKRVRISTGDFRDVEECAKDRLARNRPHGLSHGGTSAQGRPRCDHLESDTRQG